MLEEGEEEEEVGEEGDIGDIGDIGDRSEFDEEGDSICDDGAELSLRGTGRASGLVAAAEEAIAN